MTNISLKIKNPELYDELCGEIIAKVAETGWLNPILRADDRYPGWTAFYTWMADDIELATRYQQAKEFWLDNLVYEAKTIADGDNLGPDDKYNDRKVAHQINVRQWMAERALKKVWGRTVDVNHGGQKDNPITSLVEAISGNSFQPVVDDE
jgi:hypothetical protein